MAEVAHEVLRRLKIASNTPPTESQYMHVWKVGARAKYHQ